MSKVTEQTARKKLKVLLIMVGVALVTVVAVFLLPGTAADALDENQCLTCHKNPNLTRTNKDGVKVSLYVSEQEVDSGAHRYIDCTTCHTKDPHKVDTPLTKLSLAEKCGTCHQYEYKLHLQSIHGQQLAQGNPDVATCVDCHSPDSNPHSVIRTLEFGAPTYKKNIAQTCAKCHNNESLMASYGIVERVYESYLRSFHGKAIELGSYKQSSLDEATCTNCHGSHDIRSAADPNSPVTGVDNLAKTCEQCHPGAGVEFARGFLGHKETSTENIPAAHYTEIIFSVLMKSVLGFGALVVLAALVRFSVNRWRE